MTYSSNTYSDAALAALRASDATPAAVLVTPAAVQASDLGPARFRPTHLREVNLREVNLRVVNGGGRPGAKQSLLARLIAAVLEPHARLYDEAVTDPATGRPDPVLERAVGRMMMGA